MKFVKKPPITDTALSEKLINEGWRKIREPGSIAAAVACSIPFALLLGVLSILLIYILRPSLFEFIQDGNLSITFTINYTILLYAAGVYLYMLLHELIHALFVPHFLKSDNTFLGINGLFGFVYTTEALKKARFIIISIMPFILLSVLMPLVLNVVGWLCGYAAFLCFINAIGSCVDFLNVCLIAFQVPTGHTIISNGFETYHKRTS